MDESSSMITKPRETAIKLDININIRDLIEQCPECT